MKKRNTADVPPMCPSAQPEMEESLVVGVVGGTAEEPRIGYLDEPLPVNRSILELCAPIKATEVFRFAAPCGGTECRHFDGANCRLATSIVQTIPDVVDILPACQIRTRCRWWLQEGKDACVRCPQIVTERYQPTDAERMAADPTKYDRDMSQEDDKL